MIPIARLYADSEAFCQMYHMCVSSTGGSYKKFSFLCPNGTMFDQDKLSCNRWFDVDCSQDTIDVRGEEYYTEYYVLLCRLLWLIWTCWMLREPSSHWDSSQTIQKRIILGSSGRHSFDFLDSKDQIYSQSSSIYSNTIF